MPPQLAQKRVVTGMRTPQVVQNLVPSAVGTGAGEGLLASPSDAVPPVLLPFLRLRRTTKTISPIIPIKGNAMITYANADMIIDVDADVSSLVDVSTPPTGLNAYTLWSYEPT